MTKTQFIEKLNNLNFENDWFSTAGDRLYRFDAEFEDTIINGRLSDLFVDNQQYIINKKEDSYGVITAIYVYETPYGLVGVERGINAGKFGDSGSEVSNEFIDVEFVKEITTVKSILKYKDREYTNIEE